MEKGIRAPYFGKMERIFYSKSIPSKLHRHSTRLHQLTRLDSSTRLCLPATSSFPVLERPESRRINPLCCNLHSLVSAGAIDGSSPPSVDPGTVSEPNFQFLEVKPSQLQKVFDAGKVILIPAILLTSLYVITVLPALANLPGSAKAGGHAAIATGSGFLRNEVLNSAWAGFLAGCLHTLSGPDHLAALAPLSIGRTKMESAAVGALWGCGHDAGQVIFGLLFLLLKDQLHIEIIRNWGTRVVGITLLVIGAMGIKEASEVPTACVALESVEPDASGYETVASPSVGKKKKVGFATFATGIVHGLQPDALMMILPALALPSRVAGAAFLVMFLIGTVIAMGSYTVFIGSCSEALKDRVPRITEKLTWASSLIAIGLGLALLVSQVFGFSLY